MNLPHQFVNRMSQLLGNDLEPFLDSLDQEVQTTVRINPIKYKDKPMLSPVEYCDTGYFLAERPLFTIDPFFHSGVYYVQEASSMILEQVVRQLIPQTAVKVLDLCASPGGKSTHLCSVLTPGSLLISNDVIRSRAVILSENLKKWGTPNVIVTNNDPRDFTRLEGFFDLLVIDAPCSGEGLFRRDHKAISEWSEANAALCSQRQKRILADAWPSLKEGGFLVYSTCTYNPSENEENIKWLKELSSTEPASLNLEEGWGITCTEMEGYPCYRFYPHKVKGEGFFISVIRKTGEQKDFREKVDLKTSMLASKREKQTAAHLISEGYETFRFEDFLFAFPDHLINEIAAVRQNLKIVHAGTKIGQLMDKTILPAHELALSSILNRTAFPEMVLSFPETLNYLKKENLPLVSADKGWNLVSYRGIPLGWVKNLGNRFNSSLPKEWRIRMSLSEIKGEKLQQEMNKFPL